MITDKTATIADVHRLPIVCIETTNNQYSM